jgi:rhodanese-related sulfurtransferase
MKKRRNTNHIIFMIAVAILGLLLIPSCATTVTDTTTITVKATDVNTATPPTVTKTVTKSESAPATSKTVTQTVTIPPVTATKLITTTPPPETVTETVLVTIAPVKDITVVEAKEMMNTQPDIVALDVRTSSEFDEGHIEDAILHCLCSFIPQLHKRSTEDTFIVYCDDGRRSGQASQILVENGFQSVYNMVGGLIAWEQAGYPVVTT